MAAGLAVMAGLQAAMGLYQTISADQRLKKLGSRPTYDNSLLETNVRQAEDMARRGLTPQQTAAFNNQLNSSEAAYNQRVADTAGGNMARYLSGGAQARRIRGLNQLAQLDANQYQVNQNRLFGTRSQLQNQRNLQTSQDIAYRNEVERALGGAKSQGLMNMVNAPLMYAAFGGFDSPNTSSSPGMTTRPFSGNTNPDPTGGWKEFVPKNTNPGLKYNWI